MKRGYRIRVGIVLLFFISAACIVGIASLFPAYLYSTLEERSHLNQVAELQKKTDAASVTTIQRQLTGSVSLVNTINDTLQGDIFSKTIASIVAVKGNIKISSFAVEQSAVKTISVAISGFAPTRTDLLAFKLRLQGLSPQTRVDLPISALAQDKDVSFSIQINEILP